jgi:RNA polymerase primary sigma factor
MLAGLCESPLTFQAVVIWRDELNDGKVFLHDIIDLEATHAGPDAKALPAAVPDVHAPPAAPARAPPFLSVVSPQPVAPPSAPPTPTPFKPKPLNGSEEQPAEGALRESDPDDVDLENSISLAAIEAELKPKVIETFDTIAATYKRLRRLQDQDIENKLHSESLCGTERTWRSVSSVSAIRSIVLQKSKVAGHRFFAKTRNGKASPIRTTSIELPKSPVSLT